MARSRQVSFLLLLEEESTRALKELVVDWSRLKGKKYAAVEAEGEFSSDTVEEFVADSSGCWHPHLAEEPALESLEEDDDALRTQDSTESSEDSVVRKKVEKRTSIGVTGPRRQSSSILFNLPTPKVSRVGAVALMEALKDKAGEPHA